MAATRRGNSIQHNNYQEARLSPRKNAASCLSAAVLSNSSSRHMEPTPHHGVPTGPDFDGVEGAGPIAQNSPHQALPEDIGYEMLGCDNTVVVSLRDLVRAPAAIEERPQKHEFHPNLTQLVKTKRPGSGGSQSEDVQHLPLLGLRRLLEPQMSQASD